MSETPARRYLYGFVADPGVAARAVRGISGLEGAEVHVVEGPEVSALASGFSGERARGSRDALRAHEAVVAAAAGATTIVPLRFGVVMPDLASVTSLLDRNAGALGADLEQLRGRREYRVKAAYLGDTALRDVVAASPAVQRLRGSGGARRAPGYRDRIRLGELVVEGLAQLRSRDAAAVVDRLSGLVVATAVLEVRGEQAALDVAVLVDDGDAAALEVAIEGLATASADRLAFELVGPLAPWDFVRSDPIATDVVAAAGR